MINFVFFIFFIFTFFSFFYLLFQLFYFLFICLYSVIIYLSFFFFFSSSITLFLSISGMSQQISVTFRPDRAKYLPYREELQIQRTSNVFEEVLRIGLIGRARESQLYVMPAKPRHELFAYNLMDNNGNHDNYDNNNDNSSTFNRQNNANNMNNMNNNFIGKGMILTNDVMGTSTNPEIKKSYSEFLKYTHTIPSPDPPIKLEYPNQFAEDALPNSYTEIEIKKRKISIKNEKIDPKAVVSTELGRFQVRRILISSILPKDNRAGSNLAGSFEVILSVAAKESGLWTVGSVSLTPAGWLSVFLCVCFEVFSLSSCFCLCLINYFICLYVSFCVCPFHLPMLLSMCLSVCVFVCLCICVYFYMRVSAHRTLAYDSHREIVAVISVSPSSPIPLPFSVVIFYISIKNHSYFFHSFFLIFHPYILFLFLLFLLFILFLGKAGAVGAIASVPNVISGQIQPGGSWGIDFTCTLAPPKGVGGLCVGSWRTYDAEVVLTGGWSSTAVDGKNRVAVVLRAFISL